MLIPVVYSLPITLSIQSFILVGTVYVKFLKWWDVAQMWVARLHLFLCCLLSITDTITTCYIQLYSATFLAHPIELIEHVDIM